MKYFLNGWLAILLTGCSPVVLPQAINTASGVSAKTLAVIINTADPLSIQIGQYYKQQRNIPDENMILVSFDPNRSVLPVREFREIEQLVNAATLDHIQAYALTWAEPYRVGCMSITAAFAVGFSEDYCAQGCQATAMNPYFNSASATPYSTFGLRPTMAIAATTLEQAEALIDRGVRSDGTQPLGTAYLMSTSDAARNTRAQTYASTVSLLLNYLPVSVLKSDVLADKPDVLFYFTGLAQVEKIGANQFFPGAIADHLTSFGGQLTDSSQMSSLRWLEAGATGSYGAVVEPCNFPQKFPYPGVVMAHYLNGDTLIEAYWKSVAWFGQGIFIGEPLARPFGPAVVKESQSQTELPAHTPAPDEPPAVQH